MSGFRKFFAFLLNGWSHMEFKKLRYIRKVSTYKVPGQKDSIKTLLVTRKITPLHSIRVLLGESMKLRSTLELSLLRIKKLPRINK